MSSSSARSNRPSPLASKRTNSSARKCAEWCAEPSRGRYYLAFAALELHRARERVAFLLRMLELSQEPRAHQRIVGRLQEAGVGVSRNKDGLVPKGEIPAPPAIGSGG